MFVFAFLCGKVTRGENVKRDIYLVQPQQFNSDLVGVVKVFNSGGGGGVCNCWGSEF